MALLATVTTLGLAFPLCYWLVALCAQALQRVLFLLVILPFWTSYLLRVYAWVAILGDKGAMNSVLEVSGSDPRTGSPVLVRQSRRLHRPGLPVLPVRRAHPVRIAGAVRLAAAACCHGFGRHADAGHRHHVVPADALAIMTAGIFVFIPILGEYLAPAAIGGTNGVMMGNLVANFFSGLPATAGLGGQRPDRSGDSHRADHSSAATSTRRTSMADDLRAVNPRARLFQDNLMIVYGIGIYIFLFAPIAVMVLLSFNASPAWGSRWPGSPLTGTRCCLR